MNNENTRPGGSAAPPLVLSRSGLEEQVTELAAQRAAISEVLCAIASSPHELQPIFDTMVANANRLCRAKAGALFLFEGEGMRVVARRGPPNPYLAERGGYPVPPGTPYGRLVESRSPVHIADLAADSAYLERDPSVVALVEAVGARTYLLVPMLKEDELFGAFAVLRDEVQPFTDNQINLITDFAAQATIALESTRRERQYREVQMELAYANRVATMGQLTASIAHEIKQPIATARTNASVALRYLKQNPTRSGGG